MRDVAEVRLSLVVLRSRFHLFHVIDRLDYWWRGCELKCRLRTHQRPSMVGSYNLEMFVIPPISRPVYRVMEPFWRRTLERHRLLFVATPVFSYHSHYILNDYAGVQLIWYITMSELSVCTFTAFQCLACDGALSAEGSLIRRVSRIWICQCCFRLAPVTL